MCSSRGEIYSLWPALPVEILVATRPFGKSKVRISISIKTYMSISEFHVKLILPIPWIVTY